MIAQVAAASLASENKVFAHPASVDTIPTSAGQEDHVSMGMIAARKARSILENTENILAIEWLCAAQGLELRGDLDPGRGANAIRVRLREDVRPLKGDRYLHRDIKMACDLLRTGELVRAAEAAVGPLAP
jgi:histidine ammonia-lyase